MNFTLKGLRLGIGLTDIPQLIRDSLNLANVHVAGGCLGPQSGSIAEGAGLNFEDQY